MDSTSLLRTKKPLSENNKLTFVLLCKYLNLESYELNRTKCVTSLLTKHLKGVQFSNCKGTNLEHFGCHQILNEILQLTHFVLDL